MQGLQRREQQRHLDEEIPDVLPVDVFSAEEHAPETPMPVAWTKNWRLPPGLGDKEHTYNYQQGQRTLHAALAYVNLQARIFFFGLHVKSLFKMDCIMRDLAAICYFGTF